MNLYKACEVSDFQKGKTNKRTNKQSVNSAEFRGKKLKLFAGANYTCHDIVL